MQWTQDKADYSWNAKDMLGYVYRVSRVYRDDGSSRWACAWTETDGLRIGISTFENIDDAKRHMDSIAATENYDA